MGESDKVLKAVIVFFLLLISLKIGLRSNFFDSPIYNGHAFSVVRPEGWTTAPKEKVTDAGIFMMSTEKPEVVVFESPEINPYNDAPQATISIQSSQLFNPTWIDDLFPDILESLHANKYEILDQGEVKIDEQKAKWLLMQGGDTEGYKLEFYFVDERKGFYKIRYSAQKGMFDKYRADFEKCRESFDIKFLVF